MGLLHQTLKLSLMQIVMSLKTIEMFSPHNANYYILDED